MMSKGNDARLEISSWGGEDEYTWLFLGIQTFYCVVLLEGSKEGRDVVFPN